MSPAELKKALKELPTTISLKGKDQLLRDQAKTTILNTYARDVEMRDFNVDEVRGAASHHHKSVLGEEPIESDFRVVFLYSDDPDAFLNMQAQTTVLVAMKKPFVEAQLEVDCSRLFGLKLSHWVRTEGIRQGIKLDKIDVQELIKNNPSDLKKLQNEIIKLTLCGAAPSPKVIKFLCSSASFTTGWDILKHVSKGDISTAIETLQRARHSGVHVLQIIFVLQKTLLQLSHVVAGINVDAPQYELDRLERLKSRVRQNTVDDCLQDLVEAELRVKRGDSALLDIWLLTKLSQRFR